MTKGKTTFARAVVYVFGAAALAVCFILLPELAREEGVGKPFNPYLTYGFFTTAYILATPFFIALYQIHKLLGYIDKNKTFSQQSIRALQNVKWCAILFSIMVMVATISWISILRSMDPTEDMPPFFMLGFILMSISIIIAVFVAVLQKLVADAIEMKSENDLIV